MKKFDAIIIGTGQAGPSLAASLANHGKKTAIIEKSFLGGTCVNVGCTPTKAYVASARRAYIASNSGEMGVKINGTVSVDLGTIKKRKDDLIENSRNGLEKMFGDNKNITLIRGTARFLDDHTVQVGDEIFKAENIYINVGARPRIPEEFKNISYLTNESILELEEVPEHLAIVGGGYIGLEFAQIFRRFGSKVTVLDRGGRLLKKEDPEFGEVLAQVFEEEGIDIRLDSNCIVAKERSGKIELSIDCRDENTTLECTHLLIATGRIPNTSQLGLENTNVKLDKRGFIEVDDELKTSAQNIWALGDCNGKGAFTHTAYNDFQIVNSHLFETKKRKVSDRFTCYAIFTDPPLARVGMNAKEIKEAGISAKIASRPMAKIARAKEMGETTGMIKIFIEAKTNKILGATFLGTGADEYIHTVIDQMYANQPFTVIRDAVHIHPTVSELIPTMLENLENL
ncbi:FAD-containing oxidoreductase [soil metagenome]